MNNIEKIIIAILLVICIGLNIAILCNVTNGSEGVEPTQTVKPTQTPIPTENPTPTPTVTPTAIPTTEPTVAPTIEPTEPPSIEIDVSEAPVTVTRAFDLTINVSEIPVLHVNITDVIAIRVDHIDGFEGDVKDSKNIIHFATIGDFILIRFMAHNTETYGTFYLTNGDIETAFVNLEFAVSD